MPQRFRDLIAAHDRVTSREEARALEQEAWRTYGRECAVLVLDSQGFTRRTQTHGLIAALSAVARLRSHLEPLVVAAGGSMVKLEADNLFSVFPDVAEAVGAARALVALIERGELSHGTGALDACIGIDHGRILLLPGHDLYGDAVNLASKLGEDVAQAGQIYLTSRAYRRLDPAPAADVEVIALPSVTLEGYRLRQG